MVLAGAAMAEGYRKAYPNVNIQIEGKGSGTAPPALIQGTAQFAPMSRAMKGTEIQEFEKSTVTSPWLSVARSTPLAFSSIKTIPSPA